MNGKLLKVSVHNGKNGERTSTPGLSPFVTLRQWLPPAEGIEQRGPLSGTDYIASLPFESEPPRLAADGLLSSDSVAQGAFHELHLLQQHAQSLLCAWRRIPVYKPSS